jgi:hypothetical protein
MSKEEILDKQLGDFTESMLSTSDILKAMDEYAKQQSIEFNEWVEEKQFMRWRGRWYEKTNDGKSWGDFPNFSKEELYDIYFKSKQP